MAAPASAPPFARKVLVLYAPADEAFARGYLAAVLGLPVEDDGESSAVGLALSSRQLAARPVSELGLLVATSRYVLPVLTPAFLADPWLQLSDEISSHGAVGDDDRSAGVIALVLEACELPLHLRANVSLDFRETSEWDDETKRLRDTLARPPEPPPEVPCPYPGMRPFRDSDAAFFHGRDEEIAEILRRLAAGERELMVIGPSGSGKSSLIAAGVLPKLRGDKIVRSFRPGAAPLAALTAALGASVADAADATLLGRPESGLLLVIDQAEELFSLASLEERKRFITALRVLRQDPRCALILTLRADFYGELLGSELWSEGAKQHLDLAPMRGPALRRAIEEPARQRHVFLEHRLVDQLLADADDEPGALPLLQEALVQLWGARRQRLLTLDEYRSAGGLSAALIHRADHTLDALAPAHQLLARRVFLRLVAFGEGRPHTRRRQPRAALRGDEAPADLDTVLMALSQARLLTMDEAHVDLCHDVLITAWPSFASWVEARRSAEQQRRRWREHAHSWITRGRGESAHLDADELAAARAWAASADAVSVGVDPDIATLLAASEHILRSKLLRRQRRIFSTISGLAAFTLISLVLATCAFLQRKEAVSARGETTALLAAQYEDTARRFLVEDRPQRALPYLLAAREQSGEPPGPVLRALFRAASRTRVRLTVQDTAPLNNFSFSGEGKLILTSSVEGKLRLWRAEDGAALGELPAPPGKIRFVALARDGRRALALTEDRVVHLWDLRDGGPGDRRELSTHATVARLSSDGTRVLTVDQKKVQLWDAASGEPLGAPLVHDAAITDAHLSPDGAFLVALSAGDSQVTLWQLGAVPRAHRLGPSGVVRGFSVVRDAGFDRASTRLVLSFSFEGQTLVYSLAPLRAAPTAPIDPMGQLHECPGMTKLVGAYFFDGGVALVCDITVEIFREGAQHTIPFPLLFPIKQVILSDDDHSLAVSTMDSVTRVWDLREERMVARFESRYGANFVAFPDSTTLAVVDLHGPARVWQLPAHRDPATVELDELGASIALSHDGRWMATAAPDDIALISPTLDEPPVLLSLHGLPEASRLAVSPDDRWIANQTLNRSLSLCQVERKECQRLHRGFKVLTPSITEVVSPLAFSPDSKLLASPSSDHEVQLWDLTTGEAVRPPLAHSAAPTPLAPPLRHDVVSLSFSPDGKRLVSGGADGTVRVFDLSAGLATPPPSVSFQHQALSPITCVVFSPDGELLVTTAHDGAIELRDATTLQRVRSLRHDARVMAAVFSPDGKLLASLGADFRTVLWDVATGAPLHELEAVNWVTGLAFSPDGARLAILGEELRIWSVATGLPLTPPLLHTGPAGEPSYPKDLGDAFVFEMRRLRDQRILDLDFSRDGRWLFSVGADGTARRWDMSLDDSSLEEWRKLVERSPFSSATP